MAGAHIWQRALPVGSDTQARPCLPPAHLPQPSGGQIIRCMGAHALPAAADLCTCLVRPSQRVWASQDRKTLYKASVLGCILTTTMVFLSGFGAWLAMATGMATAETNPNLYLFQLFASAPNEVASLNSVVSLLTVLLAVVMNEGAIDTLQVGAPLRAMCGSSHCILAASPCRSLPWWRPAPRMHAARLAAAAHSPSPPPRRALHVRAERARQLHQQPVAQDVPPHLRQVHRCHALGLGACARACAHMLACGAVRACVLPPQAWLLLLLPRCFTRTFSLLSLRPPAHTWVLLGCR